MKTNFNRLNPPLSHKVVRNIKLWYMYTFLVEAMFWYAGTSKKSNQHKKEAESLMLKGILCKEKQIFAEILIILHKHNFQPNTSNLWGGHVTYALVACEVLQYVC